MNYKDITHPNLTYMKILSCNADDGITPARMPIVWLILILPSLICKMNVSHKSGIDLGLQIPTS